VLRFAQDFFGAAYGQVSTGKVRLHIGDTGLAAALLAADAAGLYKDRGLFGHLAETFVYQQLERQPIWKQTSHWRRPSNRRGWKMPIHSVNRFSE
jgi:predicted AAA+ superfamily ATPase